MRDSTVVEAMTMTMLEAMEASRIHNSMVWSMYCKRHGLRKHHTLMGSRYLAKEVYELMEGRPGNRIRGTKEIKEARIL